MPTVPGTEEKNRTWSVYVDSVERRSLRKRSRPNREMIMRRNDSEGKETTKDTCERHQRAHYGRERPQATEEPLAATRSYGRA